MLTGSKRQTPSHPKPLVLERRKIAEQQDVKVTMDDVMGLLHLGLRFGFFRV